MSSLKLLLFLLVRLVVVVGEEEEIFRAKFEARLNESYFGKVKVEKASNFKAILDKPKLWVFIVGHYRTFGVTQKKIEEIARKSSKNSYAAVALMPREIERVDQIEYEGVENGPLRNAIHHRGPKPASIIATFRSKDVSLNRFGTYELLKEAQTKTFLGKLAFATIDRDPPFVDYPGCLAFYWHAVWVLASMAAFPHYLENESTTLILRTRPDLNLENPIRLETFPFHLNHLWYGQEIGDFPPQRSFSNLTQGDIFALTSWSTYKTDVALPFQEAFRLEHETFSSTTTRTTTHSSLSSITTTQKEAARIILFLLRLAYANGFGYGASVYGKGTTTWTNSVVQLPTTHNSCITLPQSKETACWTSVVEAQGFPIPLRNIQRQVRESQEATKNNNQKVIDLSLVRTYLPLYTNCRKSHGVVAKPWLPGGGAFLRAKDPIRLVYNSTEENRCNRINVPNPNKKFSAGQLADLDLDIRQNDGLQQMVRKTVSAHILASHDNKIFDDISHHYHREERRLQKVDNRYCIATVIIGLNRDELHMVPSDTAHEYAHRGVMLAKSLELVGSTIERVAIVAGLNESDLKILQRFWCVRDIGESTIKKISDEFYRPVYTAQQAMESSRHWQQGMHSHARNGATRPDTAQNRKDGAATYAKFIFWSFADTYSKILFVDADVLFYQNPDPFLFFSTDYFLATNEIADRGFTGFNTHMMLLTPDPVIFKQLLLRAKYGWYLPNTNGEQDILEAQFVFVGDPHFPIHYHVNHHRYPSPNEIALAITKNAQLTDLQCYYNTHLLASSSKKMLFSPRRDEHAVRNHFIQVGFSQGFPLSCNTSSTSARTISTSSSLYPQTTCPTIVNPMELFNSVS